MLWLATSIYLCVLSKTFAVPHSGSAFSRDIAPAATGINTTVDIKDHNGLDVTSSFQIMVYQESKVYASTGLNDRSLIYRPIIECINSTFQTSYCTPEDGVAGSLQRYSIICQHHVYYRDGRRRVVGMNTLSKQMTGFCHLDEVCMNGLGPGSAQTQGRQWASCVQKSIFDGTMYGKGSQTKEDVQTILDDASRSKSAYMVISDSDGSRAREADVFDLSSWIGDNMDGDGNVRENKCHNCTSLTSERLAPDTKALKAEATLLSAGAAAGTMILWLGIMSG